MIKEVTIGRTDRTVSNTLDIRKTILESSHASGHGHIPTSFSIVEMLVSTYNVMKHDPSNPSWAERDLFVLSKGHASLGYYSVLAEFGYFSEDEVKTFGARGSMLGCHPDRLKVPGVEVSCGSLGHGIGVAVGMALAIKIKKSDRQVYVIIGDGESNEGSVWEAVMVAADQGLNNLTILYDYNKSQSRCLQIRKPSNVFKAFGCETYEVDGHSLNQLEETLRCSTNKPKCIVANTVKGMGCATLVDKVFEWHRRSPKAEELDMLMKELHA